MDNISLIVLTPRDWLSDSDEHLLTSYLLLINDRELLPFSSTIPSLFFHTFFLHFSFNFASPLTTLPPSSSSIRFANFIVFLSLILWLYYPKKQHNYTVVPHHLSREMLLDKQQSSSDWASPSPPAQSLRRELTFVDGICFIISIMIGSGIFASPGVTLERAGSPGECC